MCFGCFPQLVLAIDSEFYLFLFFIYPLFIQGRALESKLSFSREPCYNDNINSNCNRFTDIQYIDMDNVNEKH